MINEYKILKYFKQNLDIIFV